MDMIYRPKFTTTERNGELSIWVTMPDGWKYNVWDIPAEDVRKYAGAIAHAFELGAKSVYQRLSHLCTDTPDISELEKKKMNTTPTHRTPYLEDDQ